MDKLYGEFIFAFLFSLTISLNKLFKETGNVKEEYILVAKNLGLTPKEISEQVYWKSVQPKFLKYFEKVHILLSSVLLAFEFVGDTNGIGKVLKEALADSNLTATIIIGIIIIVFILLGNPYNRILSQNIYSLGRLKMIKVKNITKLIFDELGIKQVLLKEISFDIPDGIITSIVAPENSNVSILLKIISGLENSTSGSIVNNSAKKVVYIPSLPSSFPWLNVEQNLMIGKKTGSNNSINSLINMVGLEGYEKYRPHNSSIGFRFRISLARALAQKPSLIILDNAFKFMGSEIRKEIYSIVKDINKSMKTSFLISTMDITEALSLSDNVILMKKEPDELISAKITNLPLSENWIIKNREEFLKIKNNIELFFMGK